jgi:hypothetical protein
MIWSELYFLRAEANLKAKHEEIVKMEQALDKLRLKYQKKEAQISKMQE